MACLIIIIKDMCDGHSILAFIRASSDRKLPGRDLSFKRQLIIPKGSYSSGSKRGILPLSRLQASGPLHNILKFEISMRNAIK